MNTTQKRDPDEIILTSRAGVGGAGRIPVIGRVGDGAQPADDGERRELSQDKLAAAGLLDLDDDEDGFDLSIEASIRSNNSTWHLVSELRGAIMSSPSCPGRDHAGWLIDQIDCWFGGQEKRLRMMIARRDNTGGEQ